MVSYTLPNEAHWGPSEYHPGCYFLGSGSHFKMPLCWPTEIRFGKGIPPEAAQGSSRTPLGSEDTEMSLHHTQVLRSAANSVV